MEKKFKLPPPHAKGLLLHLVKDLVEEYRIILPLNLLPSEVITLSGKTNESYIEYKV